MIHDDASGLEGLENRHAVAGEPLGALPRASLPVVGHGAAEVCLELARLSQAFADQRFEALPGGPTGESGCLCSRQRGVQLPVELVHMGVARGD
jgi:hypothetical protein